MPASIGAQTDTPAAPAGRYAARMTYSIVARDPVTGRFGVAVQSHFLSVGPVVPWLEAGVGAVATQASVNISFGPIALEMLRAGWEAERIIAALVAGDPGAAQRQIGVVDAEGRAAAHTGAECILACGHHVGDGYTTQGNLLRTTRSGRRWRRPSRRTRRGRAVLGAAAAHARSGRVARR